MSLSTDFLKKNLTVKQALICMLSLALLFFGIVIINQKDIYKNDAVISCDTCGIGISDLVRRVKRELAQLEDSMAQKNENAMFQLKDMGMEISFVVRQSTSGKVS